MKKAKKVQNYQIFKSNKESSFGFWLMPMITLILIGAIYIYVIIWQSQDSLLSDQSTPRQTTANSLTNNLDDLLDKREHAGPELDLNEATWGKSDPFLP